MISKTFFEQLELMAKEKEMSYEEILEATKKSLANAYKKSEGLNSNVPIRIELKPEKHEIQIYAQSWRDWLYGNRFMGSIPV